MINISNFKIPTDMLDKISEIDKFNVDWNSNMLDRMPLEKLKKISTIESVGASNRIEGNALSNEDVETILKNVETKSFQTRDEQEVAGYANLLNIIFENFSQIPLTENYIKQLHKIMLSKVSKDTYHCGEYKKISNAVSAFDEGGKEVGVIFKTAKPFETPRLMAELVNWTNDALEKHSLHMLIVIAIFIVHFLAIHPFQDGNGRLSRALTTLLLLKNGYNYVFYSSAEAIIEENKKNYYAALRCAQKNIFTEAVDYQPWIIFFLEMLQKQEKNLQEKLL